MEARIVLGSDDAFTRAKEALKHLWKHRADEELHEIEIKAWKKTRSTQANNYYWGVVVKRVSDHLGYTPEETHTVLLGTTFGWKTISDLEGRERQVPNRRTTEPEKMSVQDFNIYIEHCIRIAAEQGITIDQSGWRE
jgi:hypothetical protein